MSNGCLPLLLITHNPWGIGQKHYDQGYTAKRSKSISNTNSF
jgi:hypothetical protein